MLRTSTIGQGFEVRVDIFLWQKRAWLLDWGNWLGVVSYIVHDAIEGGLRKKQGYLFLRPSFWLVAVLRVVNRKLDFLDQGNWLDMVWWASTWAQIELVLYYDWFVYYAIDYIEDGAICTPIMIKIHIIIIEWSNNHFCCFFHLIVKKNESHIHSPRSLVIFPVHPRHPCPLEIVNLNYWFHLSNHRAWKIKNFY